MAAAVGFMVESGRLRARPVVVGQDMVFSVLVDGRRVWRCRVGGREFGDWQDKGAALAGLEVELRRARAAHAREVDRSNVLASLRNAAALARSVALQLGADDPVRAPALAAAREIDEVVAAHPASARLGCLEGRG